MQNTRLSKLVFFVALMGAFASCNPYATHYRKEGFNLTQKGFASIAPTPDVYEVIELKNVKIVIVGDRKHFNYEKAAAYGSPVAGYANTNNEIYLFGKRVENKIVVNQAILGHEFNHLLNFKNKKIADPDKLDKMGL
ncbi:MAG: hypothetical protein GY846_03575 [Deltaproteobacteria bacterium]|nr:hypothetical protein [Deltaproteobacteria bacterium]